MAHFGSRLVITDSGRGVVLLSVLLSKIVFKSIALWIGQVQSIRRVDMSWQYKMVKKFQLHSKGVVVSGLTDLGWVLIIRQLLTTEDTHVEIILHY